MAVRSVTAVSLPPAKRSHLLMKEVDFGINSSIEEEIVFVRRQIEMTPQERR